MKREKCLGPTKHIENIYLHLDKKYKAPLGWLAPDGSYFPCDGTGHRAYADALQKKYYPQAHINKVDPMLYSEDCLVSHGWIKLTTETVYEYYCRCSTMYDNPTKEQENAICVWAKNNDQRLPWEYKKDYSVDRLGENW